MKLWIDHSVAFFAIDDAIVLRGVAVQDRFGSRALAVGATGVVSCAVDTQERSVKVVQLRTWVIVARCSFAA